MCTHGLFQAATCMHFPRMIRHQYFQFRSGTSQIRKMNRYHHLQPAGGGVFHGFLPWDFCWTELTGFWHSSRWVIFHAKRWHWPPNCKLHWHPSLSFLDKSLVNSLPRRWEFTAVEVHLHCCCRSPCMNRNPPVPRRKSAKHPPERYP